MHANMLPSFLRPSPLTIKLAEIGLSRYEKVLRENGFDDWETVSAVTESDMVEMGFSIGDRRKLQQAIAKAGDSPSSTQTKENPPPVSTKRKYQRRPQADPNAPVRPKTAYVLFGEHVRTDPEFKNLSFAEAARETGRLWAKLSDEERTDLWERPAAEKLAQYKIEQKDYERTQEYRDHKAYLADFHATKSNSNETEGSTPKSLKQEPPEQEQTATWFQTESRLTFPLEDPLAEDKYGDKQMLDAKLSPLEAGLQEVSNIAKALGVTTRFNRMKPWPPEEFTASAVEVFLHNTGSLLYLWTKDEAAELLKSVYHSERGPSPAQAVDVFAMAAIGSYCDGDIASTTLELSFMDAFINFLSSQSKSEIDGLHAMRLFACLAICRMTNNVQSARSLMSAAIRVGRETLTSAHGTKAKEGSKSSYWWSIYRSILFLESWLAYNIGQESRVTEEDLTSYRFPMQPDYHIGTVHERVGDLGRLAAYIALDLRAQHPIKAQPARENLDILTQWHRTLPPPMQLARLDLSDPLTETGHTKRAVLQLHILFLGLFIEPFKACLVDLGQARLGQSTPSQEDMESMEYVEAQSILAARQSARVASLLQMNRMVRSHCWVTVYTSFNACAILLFSASQRMLSFAGEEVGHDLSYASSHLNLLSLCSYNSSTAYALYTTLQVIYNDIRETVVSPKYRALEMQQASRMSGLAGLVGQPKYESMAESEEMQKSIKEVIHRVMDVLHKPLDN